MAIGMEAPSTSEYALTEGCTYDDAMVGMRAPLDEHEMHDVMTGADFSAIVQKRGDLCDALVAIIKPRVGRRRRGVVGRSAPWSPDASFRMRLVTITAEHVCGWRSWARRAPLHLRWALHGAIASTDGVASGERKMVDCDQIIDLCGGGQTTRHHQPHRQPTRRERAARSARSRFPAPRRGPPLRPASRAVGKRSDRFGPRHGAGSRRCSHGSGRQPCRHYGLRVPQGGGGALDLIKFSAHTCESRRVATFALKGAVL